MKYKTKVNIKYRTPYIPKKDIPIEQIKLMKREISHMRDNLIRKQAALERSKEFSANPRLKAQLQALRVADLDTNKKVWDTWHRLLNMERNNQNSVTGQREKRKATLASLHERGLTFINRKNLAEFGRFMNWVKDEYGAQVFSSDEVAVYFYEHSGESLNAIKGSFEKYIRDFEQAVNI